VRRHVVLAFLALLFVGATLPVDGAAAARPKVIRVGDASPVACGVKWQISGTHGHRPNIYTVRGTYSRPLKPDCNYAGKAFGAAVVAYKYRLGYPTKYLKPIVGPLFLKLLKGPHDRRPLLWVALAQRRAKPIVVGPTKLAQQIVAFESRQVGTHETSCSSCNRGNARGPGGYTVDDFEQHFGLLGLQWCGIFGAFSFEHFGIQFAPAPYNRFYVPSIGQWALNHGDALVRGKDGKWRKVGKARITAQARVGMLVAFLRSSSAIDGYHVGTVAAINAKGYYTIEGNSGDAVRRHWYPWGTALRIFIAVPGVA
jgi:hypothetical protein